MKQGIVMDIKNKKAIVLTQDGTFETVSLRKGQQVEIGAEIDVPVSKTYFNSYSKRITTFIAAAAVLILFFTQLPLLKQSNLTVAAYVGLDINPSIEVGINEKLHVVEVIPINDDGKRIVDQINGDFRNKTLSEFIDDTIELAKADGYLTENKDVLLTTTTIKKEAQIKIEEKVNVIKKEIEQAGVAVTTIKGDETTRKEAKKLGVSTGKYVIYKESKNALTIEETKKLSVTKIYEKLDENTKKKLKEENFNLKEKPNKEKKHNNKEEKNDKEKKKNSKEKNNKEDKRNKEIIKENKREQKSEGKERKAEDRNNVKVKNAPNNEENKKKNKDNEIDDRNKSYNQKRAQENNKSNSNSNKNLNVNMDEENHPRNQKVEKSNDDSERNNKEDDWKKEKNQQQFYKDREEYDKGYKKEDDKIGQEINKNKQKDKADNNNKDN